MTLGEESTKNQQVVMKSNLYSSDDKRIPFKR
jgi:hypothetical protein